LEGLRALLDARVRGHDRASGHDRGRLSPPRKRGSRDAATKRGDWRGCGPLLDARVRGHDRASGHDRGRLSPPRKRGSREAATKHGDWRGCGALLDARVRGHDGASGHDSARHAFLNIAFIRLSPPPHFLCPAMPVGTSTLGEYRLANRPPDSDDAGRRWVARAWARPSTGRPRRVRSGLRPDLALGPSVRFDQPGDALVRMPGQPA